MPQLTMPTRSGGASSTAPQNDENDVVKPGEGAEDRTGSAEERLGSREALFDKIDAQRNAGVQADIDYAFSTGDPAAAQAEAARRKTVKDKEPAAPAADTQSSGDGAKATDPEEDDAEGREAPGASTEETNPFGGHMVTQDGKAMFKLKVDGKERLVPLDTAIAQLQKGEAAEVRLQQAAGLRKTLDAREADLNAREAKLKSQPSAPPAAADDPNLDAEVQGVVDSLLTDDPAVAAKKLKGVLVKVRQAATPSINEDAIVSKAVQATRKTIAEDGKNKSLVDGLKKFKDEYSDIASDPRLEQVADGMTDSIAAEHPEWSPEQVMLEAGKQTREWIGKLSGKPASPTTTTLADDRRDRKVGLRPLPAARAATRPAAKTATVVETPASIVAEMRKARGQA